MFGTSRASKDLIYDLNGNPDGTMKPKVMSGMMKKPMPSTKMPMMTSGKKKKPKMMEY